MADEKNNEEQNNEAQTRIDYANEQDRMEYGDNYVSPVEYTG